MSLTRIHPGALATKIGVLTHFLGSILPQLRREIPAVSLAVVGGDPTYHVFDRCPLFDSSCQYLLWKAWTRGKVALQDPLNEHGRTLNTAVVLLREIVENRRALAECGRDPRHLAHFCYLGGVPAGTTSQVEVKGWASGLRHFISRPRVIAAP